MVVIVSWTISPGLAVGGMVVAVEEGVAVVVVVVVLVAGVTVPEEI
jgi:hypothetical protein